MNIRLTIITILTVCTTLWLMPEASGVTFTVANTNDSGTNSLRQAILSANATTGATITFSIPGTDANCSSTTHVCTITPQTVLPTISSTVTIDGYTQPGTSANTLANGDNAVIRIALSGTTVESTQNLLAGLTIAASNCIVRGLAIAGFYEQILISSGSGNLISGNFLGTNASGTAVVTTGYTGANLGVSVQSANNTIGGTSAAARNVIGVRSNGVENGSSATGTLIQGNFIGTDHTGTVGFLVGNSGVHDNGANSVTIGGTVSGARNVISGNSGDGLDITGSFVVIEGNFIGTDVTGTNAVGNNSGVSICGSCMNDKIGGRTAAARNIISGNRNTGLAVSGSSHTVQGNFIGTDVTGTKAVPNGNGGVDLSAGTPTGILIGGVTAIPGKPPGNVISGNSGGSGVGLTFFGAQHCSAEGNIIGADVTGKMPLGNTGGGVLIVGSSNVVGGTSADTGNLIAYNGAASNSAGVAVTGSTNVNNSIHDNSIFSNTRLGIDLGADGVTANDPCDVDTGPNNFQNYPVLTTASSNGISTIVQGTLNSKASTTFQIEFFANDLCDPSGNGQGQTFLGTTSVTTNSSCNATINVTLPAASITTVTSSLNPSTQGTAVTFTATVRSATTGTAGKRITATATDPSGNTSEFSNCVLSTMTTTATPTGTVTFKDGATVLATRTLSSGRATFTMSTLAVGNHSITAVYGGNADLTGSKSRVLIQTVN